MRACSFVCIIGTLCLLLNQFYRGLDWEQLFIAGFVVVAIWTDCERWLRYKLGKRGFGHRHSCPAETSRSSHSTNNKE